MESQFEELAHNPDIIVATPSTLMYHLTKIDDMSLHTVEYVVFDEADCLFGMGLLNNCIKFFLSWARRKVCSIVSAKHYVEFLYTLFGEEGIEPFACYDDMDQDRKIHISRFRSGKTVLLIVIDVVARGIGILLLDNVINRDFPSKPKIFVHRVGRATRAGRTGTAYSFVTLEDMPYLIDLFLFLSKLIKVEEV